MVSCHFTEDEWANPTVLLGPAKSVKPDAVFVAPPVTRNVPTGTGVIDAFNV